MRPGWGLVPEELVFPLGTAEPCAQWPRLAVATLGTAMGEKTIAWVGGPRSFVL